MWKFKVKNKTKTKIPAVTLLEFTIKLFKIVPTDQLHPMIKYFYPDRSSHFLVSQMHWLHSHQISTQLNTHGRFWLAWLVCLTVHFTTLFKIPNLTLFFGRIVFHYSSRTSKTCNLSEGQPFYLLYYGWVATWKPFLSKILPTLSLEKVLTEKKLLEHKEKDSVVWWDRRSLWSETGNNMSLPTYYHLFSEAWRWKHLAIRSLKKS